MLRFAGRSAAFRRAGFLRGRSFATLHHVMASLLESSKSVARVWVATLALVSIVDCGGQDSSSASNDDPAAVASEFVTAHNLVRSEVTQPTNYPGTWAPLPQVSWSATVAASAQAWADHLRDTAGCDLAHDDTSEYGENIAGGTVGFFPDDAVTLWASEKPRYVFDPVYTFDNNTGHYTQVVWRSSTEIGCGVSRCSTGHVVDVCRYNPAGNVIGTQPY
jgi:pathogenesis-related protein 1